MGLCLDYWTPQVKLGSSKNVNNDDGSRVFRIRDVGECTINRDFGYTVGRPCVLVKMNKVKRNEKYLKHLLIKSKFRLWNSYPNHLMLKLRVANYQMDVNDEMMLLQSHAKAR